MGKEKRVNDLVVKRRMTIKLEKEVYSQRVTGYNARLLTADRVVVPLHGRVELALDASIGRQRDGLLSLEMFQDDVGLAQQKLISQETANSFSVDLVELVVVEG